MQCSGVDAIFGCCCNIRVLMQCLGVGAMFRRVEIYQYKECFQQNIEYMYQKEVGAFQCDKLSANDFLFISVSQAANF